jgi:hypothetical protein
LPGRIAAFCADGFDPAVEIAMMAAPAIVHAELDLHLTVTSP